jgi:hypothetical protein
MIDQRLDQITKTDIEALIAEKRPEGRSLDYKRDLELSTDAHKKELARDVASFANAGGGDLIFGIEEEKDANNKNLGVPLKAVGVADNLDLAKQRFEAIVRGNIAPRVQGLSFREVAGFERGPVLIVRVRNSWSGPHMVTSNESPFWSRNNSGRQALDVHEIRAAFLTGTEMAARVRRFRDERLGKIVAGDTPIPLREQDEEAKLVIHVMPLANEPISIDFPMLSDRPDLFRAPGGASNNERYNLDGLVSYASQTAYTQAFRDGSFEGVTTGFCYPGPPGEPPQLFALPLETAAVKAVNSYLEALKAHGFEGPVSVMLAVIGAKGSRIALETHGFRPPPWEREHTIDRDVLVLPDVVVEQTPADPRVFMRPTFDALWQSSGFKRSRGYTEAGDWDASKHLQ